jgi:hypothetical protein
MRAKRPPSARNCCGGPCSTRRPSSRTRTRSASFVGPRRWEISAAVCPAAKVAKRSNHANSASGSSAGRRFVEDNEVGVRPEEGTGDGQSLPLPTREVDATNSRPSRRSALTAGAGRSTRSSTRWTSPAASPWTTAPVVTFSATGGEPQRSLEHGGAAAADVGQGDRRKVQTIQQDAAGGGTAQTEQEGCQRALACPVGANHRDDLPGTHLCTDVREGIRVCPRVAITDPLQTHAIPYWPWRAKAHGTPVGGRGGNEWLVLRGLPIQQAAEVLGIAGMLDELPPAEGNPRQ